jgi:hypothetical protein
MQFELTPTNIMIFGIISGVVFGLIPLVLGLVKKNLKFGLIGFGSSIIGGAILGIFLSIPVSAVFSWLILRKPKAEESANTENSSEAEIAETENPSQEEIAESDIS